MADLKRWFKVWTSVLVDMDNLSAEAIGHWVRLGARIALVGTRGTVQFDDLGHAARFLRVPQDDIKMVLTLLPGVQFEEGKYRHGDFCVTMNNWKKYQVDSTQAERAKTSRSKRRGEEKRKDERRGDETDAAPHGVEFKVNSEIVEALKQAPKLGAVSRLWTVDFWRAEVRANPGVDFAPEILKAEAWLAANPQRAPRKDLARFLHNWLARADHGEDIP